MGVRRLGRILRLFLLVYLLTLACVIAVERIWPRDTVPARADAIICLGGGASEDGLNSDSRMRALRCAALFHAGVAPEIHFTGVIAAPLMADLAETAGVPRAAIRVEALSRSTLQNALFTSRFVALDRRVVVVSTAFHLPRSWVSFRVMGYEDVALVASGPPIWRPRPLLREALAIWVNAGRAAFWLATPWLDLDLREQLLI